MNKYFIQDGMVKTYNDDGELIGYPMVSLCTLLNRKDKQLKLTEKALELACDFNASTACGGNCEYCRFQDICIEIGLDANYVNYFIKKAKEELKNE